MVVYQGRPGLASQAEYATRGDGIWYRRIIQYARKTSVGKPTKWRTMDGDMAMHLVREVNPDSPPERIEYLGNPLHRIRIGVRLPPVAR